MPTTAPTAASWRPDPSRADQRGPGPAELRVEHRHLEGGRHQAPHRVGVEEGGDARRSGQLAPAGRRRPAQPDHARAPQGRPHPGKGRVHGAGDGEGAALPPPLGAVGDHAGVDHRAPVVGARRRHHGVAQGQRRPRAVRRLRASPPRPVAHRRPTAPTLGSTARPGWRNGRRGGLKSLCPKGRAGSNPAPGTTAAGTPSAPG